MELGSRTIAVAKGFRIRVSISLASIKSKNGQSTNYSDQSPRGRRQVSCIPLKAGTGHLSMIFSTMR